MKRVIRTILGALLVIGLFAGAGFVGYRVGYRQGIQASANGAPPPNRFEHFGRDDLPGRNFFRFERDFERGLAPGGFLRMRGERGFGFFMPIFSLVRVAVLGLIIWLVYKLFTGAGWKLSLTRQSAQSAATTGDESEKKTE